MARTRPSSTASTSTTQAPTTNSQRPRFRRLSPDEMVDKRRKGECYFCPEIFSLDHKCAMKGVFLMELDDHDDPDSLANDLGISLHALTGISATNTMQQKITIAGDELLALVDSGSTHTFIDDQVVSHLGLDIMLRPGLSLKVANGEKVQSYGVCKGTSLDIQGEQFSIDCYALPLEGFEIILGVHWLKSLGPIMWDFAALSMAFYRDGRAVCFHCVGSSPLSLHAIHTTRNLMESLLLDFTDIFEAPRDLPPQRRHDHRIHLLPGIAPVAVRPYQCPQLLKDEVER
jgi:hypothetical protein